MPYDTEQLECWLHSQVKVIDAWMGELLSAPDSDLETARRLEAHRQWLSAEIARISPATDRVDTAVRSKA